MEQKANSGDMPHLAQRERRNKRELNTVVPKRKKSSKCLGDKSQPFCIIARLGLLPKLNSSSLFLCLPSLQSQSWLRRACVQSGCSQRCHCTETVSYSSCSTRPRLPGAENVCLPDFMVLSSNLHKLAKVVLASMFYRWRHGH